MDSFQDLKDKYKFYSEKQLERTKKENRPSKFSEIADKSKVKLLVLKKVLRIKMDEKKRQRYEKRLLMYKIANEEIEVDQTDFFDENESECKPNKEENSQTQPQNSERNDASQDKHYFQNNSNENLSDKSDDDNWDEKGHEYLDKNELKLESMNRTSDNLIEQNHDQLTRMINKTQQSQLDDEGLLDLCSAKVAASDFIDDECDDDDDDDDDDDVCSTRVEAEDTINSIDEQEANSQDNEIFNEVEEKKVLSEKEDNTSTFDLMKSRLKRFRELDSESDDDFSCVNRFKFKKKCKIQDSDSENDKLSGQQSCDFSFKDNFKNQLSENEESGLSKLSPIDQDDFDNLNSQDSQIANNRESTFLENRTSARRKRFDLKNFIEDQAELSEEDKDQVSSDEEEDSNDEYEQEEIDEDLPSDEEILKANNRIFLKQQIDEDKRELLEYQERFLEYGELHDDGEVRQRKFRWKNTDQVWLDDIKESSDSDEFDIDDSQIDYTSMHLKHISEIDKTASNDQSNEATQSSQSNLTRDEKRKKKLMDTSLSKTHLASYSTFDNSIFNKHMKAFKRNMVNGPANDIKSYIIKDKNLVNAISIKSSVSAINKEKTKQMANRNKPAIANKKRKNDKNENKKSIFDLF